MIHEFHFRVYISERSEHTVLKKYLHMHVQCNTIHNSQEAEATKICSSIDEWIIWYMYTMEYCSG